MNNEQVRVLLEKYRAGTLTPEERAILESWYLNKVSDDRDNLSNEALWTNMRIIEKAIFDQTKPRQSRHKFIWAAAAAILIVGASLFFIMSRIDNQSASMSEDLYGAQDVLPGGNKATLTLADGKTIDLSADKDGIIMTHDEIVYTDGTDVLGQGTNSEEQGFDAGQENLSVRYYVLNTPNGGQYRMTLSDGTKVWLNAASTLRYPSAFTGNIRAVELEGEAYFEVSSTPARKGDQRSVSGNRLPFVVKSKGQEITVLGTEFNVSAYTGEKVTTTLVNGKVRISSWSSAGTAISDLVPGQEAILSETGVEVRQADLLSAIAWKSGKFRFHEMELRAAMNQLSRWYDLEVEYSGSIPDAYFYGVINRDKPLSTVLDVLKEGGVNFKIEKTGPINKLIVLP